MHLSEILAFRKAMWEKVAGRLHTVQKIFPFGKDSKEVMLFGKVAYVLKDGKKADVEWAGRAELVQEGGKWKLAFYQVFMVSGFLVVVKRGAPSEGGLGEGEYLIWYE
ncbi:hypothetical protein SBOR_2713 [Sclerotinia borealis F-4128]|uniref:SnoaL-like domain-containing protein n=1 Tax=Sclerotinia borealis (strain F-4128) TaxID=1432307 RepID=W9CQN7_SCLBF|nr:hypothetical protein SBOR_2713 [Sclerotinia borealis F-4128]